MLVIRELITMSWFFEHLEVLIIVSAVLLLLVLLAWMYSHRQRRAHMLLHSEHDLYEDNYLEEKVYGSGSPDDPFFDEQPFTDTGEWEQTVTPVTSTAATAEAEPPPPPITNAEPEPEYEQEVAEPAHNAKSDNEELIIALFVVAPKGQVFYGLDLFSVFEELGMRYGHMKIYHHYGLGELKVEEPIFSVANLMEPGTFDPSNREEFNTPGVAMFMRLPGPFGGRVALELLLNCAQKLAAQMEGQVVNDRRQVLDQKLIEQLRHKIMQFEAQAA